jgi:hypothetical protein
MLHHTMVCSGVGHRNRRGGGAVVIVQYLMILVAAPLSLVWAAWVGIGIVCDRLEGDCSITTGILRRMK